MSVTIAQGREAIQSESDLGSSGRYCGNGRFARGAARILLCAVLPCAVVATGITVRQALGPFWINDNSDPDYQYLFSSMLIATGHAPSHVDHPGTPVQTLGAIVLRARHFLAGSGEFSADILRDPEGRLETIRLTLTVLYGLILWAGAVLILRSTNSWLAVLLWQLTPWLSVECVAALGRFSPEPLLLCLAGVLALGIVHFSQNERCGSSRGFALFCGACLGLLTATKVTSLPLLVLPLLLLSGWRLRLTYAGAVLAAAGVAVAPIISRRKQVFRWLWNLTTHDGQYGAGEASVINTSRYLSDLGQLLWSERLVVGLSVLSLAVIALSWRRSWPSEVEPRLMLRRRGLLAILCVQALQFLMVAKHPMARYLLPAVSLAGTQLVLLFLLLHSMRVSRIARVGMLGSVFAVAAVVQAPALAHWSEARAAMRAECLRVHERAQAEASDVPVVRWYCSSSIDFALYFGNDSAGARYSEQLKALYPHAFAYIPSRKTLSRFSRPLTEAERQDVLARSIWVGSPFEQPDLKRLRPGEFILERIDGGEHEAIYRAHAKPVP